MLLDTTKSDFIFLQISLSKMKWCQKYAQFSRTAPFYPPFLTQLSSKRQYEHTSFQTFPQQKDTTTKLQNFLFPKSIDNRVWWFDKKPEQTSIQRTKE